MHLRNSFGFRVTACILVWLVFPYLVGAGTFIEAQAAERRAVLRAREAAKNLGIDPLQLEDPAAWDKKEAAAAEKRRKDALVEMKRHADRFGGDAKRAKAKALADDIQKKRGQGKLELELAKGRGEKRNAAELNRRLRTVSPAFGKAMDARPREGGVKGEGLHLMPRPKERAAAPLSTPPRFRSPEQKWQRGALPDDMRELYASVQGESVYVEQVDGSVLPVETVLEGVAPRESRVAGLLSDMGLGLPLLGALPAPASEDLAETAETRRTPEIVALASRLQNSPVAIFNHVRNNVKPDLYYGSKKGAAATLEEGRGNDFDTAALLVALLRAAQIPARYEYGAVRLTPAQAISLTGAKNLQVAAAMLSRGSPTALSADGKTVVIERVWVRAHVPYGNYRGTGKAGENLWVRLDPSIKPVVYAQAVDLTGVVHFNFDGYLSALRPETPAEAYEVQLLAAAKAKNLCNTLDAAIQKTVVSGDEFRLLPAEHPAKVEESLMTFARPPTEMRHAVTIDLDGETYSAELSEIQGRSLAITYPGATASDVSAITAAGGIENVVPYEVKVAPTLILDGTEVKRFRAQTPGNSQRLSLRVSVPGASPAVGLSELIAGGVYGVWVNGGWTTQALVDKRQRELQAASPANRALAQSQAALAWYGHQSETQTLRLFEFQRHTAVRDVQLAIAGRHLKVSRYLDVPVALAKGNYVIDVTRTSLTPVSRNGDASAFTELFRLAGVHGSALEHKVWEVVLSASAISSVRVIQAAGSQVVPVYKLTKGSTQRSLLSGYSSITLEDIDESLNAGWTVTVPQRPVTFADIPDAVGYIMENAALGQAIYRINSLLNGGSSNGNGSSGPPNCPPCSSDEPTTNSTVNMADGNMRESWTDLTLPAIGLPIVWSRTYASRATSVSELGFGWMHSYGTHLRAEPQGRFIYVTSDFREVTFTPSGSAFSTEPGWHMTLTSLPDGKRLRLKDGLTYEFANDGKLRSIAEPSGNRTDLVYAGGLLSQVKDSNGQVALTLAHVGNKISRVTDSAGRVVEYTHDGDNLASAKDVLAHVESYGYDADHNLTQRTDKLGNVWQSFYDVANDRWVGNQRPDGTGFSAHYDVPNGRSVLIDPMGAAWPREFDASGRPTARTDPLGNRTETTWDSSFNKLTEKDARGNVTTMTYDGQGNVLTRRLPDGRTDSYSYDATFSRVLAHQQPGAARVENRYDAAGRLTSRDVGGLTTTYTYDAKGQLKTVTEPGSTATTMDYDSHGNIVSMTDPTSRTTTLGYNAAGRLTRVTDGTNHSQTMEVDAAGRVLATVDARNNRTTHVYDAEGHRTRSTDPANGVTEWTHDPLGRTLTTKNAAGGTTRVAYDAAGRAVSVTQPNGARTQMRYDAAGHVVATISPSGATSSVAYCADVTQPCASVDAAGNLTVTEFDATGRTTRVVDALGRETKTEFNSDGLVLRTTGPGQPRTTYAYDGLGRIQSLTTDALATSYSYDSRGNRTRVSAGGQVTEYTYDNANRLLTETNPLQATTTFTYDAAGRRKTKLDANGKTTTYVHDDVGRVTQAVFADGTKYEFSYDSRGNRTLEKSPTHERHLGHDALGRVTRTEDVTLGRVLTTAFDAMGNKLSVTDGEGLSQSFTYDAEGRLKRASDAAGNAATFQYDVLGRRTQLQRTNGVQTAYRYDAASQIVSISHTKGAGVLSAFSYEYDASGLRTSKRMEDGTAEKYAYDASHRLTGVIYGDGRAKTYTLTPLGAVQRIDATKPDGSLLEQRGQDINLFNQVTQSNRRATDTDGGITNVTTSFAYDANGNLKTESVGSTPQRTHGYDFDNRLRTLSGPGTYSGTFEYDANGLRTKKTENAISTAFVIEGAEVLQELDSDGATVTSYLHNPQAIDDVLAIKQGNNTLWPLTDALGSVYALSDASGVVSRRYVYDVYGERTSSESSGVATARGFTSREHDTSGLNYNRDRYLDKSLARWTQPDRLGVADGQNSYSYVRANPALHADSSGQITEIIIFQPVGYGSSSFGHIATRINETSFSFGPSGMSVTPASEYMRLNDFREARGIIVFLSPQEEELFEQTLRDFARGGDYQLLERNCATPAIQGLNSIGLSLQISILPHILFADLSLNNRAVAQTFYPRLRAPNRSITVDVGNSMTEKHERWSQVIWDFVLHLPSL